MTLYQKPNKYLTITLIGLALSYIPQNIIHNVGELLLVIFGTIWSVLEMDSGINYFRRILGAVVLVLIYIALAT